MRIRAPFRRAGARRRVDSLLPLLLLTWAAVFVPRALQSLTAPKFRVAVGDTVEQTAVAAVANQVLVLAVLGYCLVLVLGRVQRLPATRLGPLVVLLAPWLYLISRDLFLQVAPRPATLVYGAVVLAVWVLQPRLRDLRHLALVGLLSALVSIALALALPDRGLFTSAGGEAIVPEKAILPIGVLVGVFTSGNNLGQVLAAASPAVLLLPRRHRPLVGGVLLLTLVWTASRSSLIAVGAAALAAVLVSSVPAPVRAGLAGLLATTACAVLVVLPLAGAEDAAFTNRGYIWRLSLENWAQSPAFGLGSGWYARVGGSSEEIAATAFHAHNQLVQMLVTGGWVLAVLFGLLLVVAVVSVSRSAGRGEVVPLAFLVALAVTCTFEVSLGFVDRGFLVPTVVLPLATVLLAREPERSRPIDSARLPQDRSVRPGPVPDGTAARAPLAVSGTQSPS